MREDYLEQLGQMFPHGFLILTVDENGGVRETFNNPNESNFIVAYHTILHLIQGLIDESE